jgi:hypothetical protein
MLTCAKSGCIFLSLCGASRTGHGNMLVCYEVETSSAQPGLMGMSCPLVLVQGPQREGRGGCHVLEGSWSARANPLTCDLLLMGWWF